MGSRPFAVVTKAALVAILAASAAFGNNLTVGCAGASGTFDYNSLATAVANLSGNNDVVTVSGTCTEVVVIQNENNLQLIGNPGSALVDPGGPPNSDAVLVLANSFGVHVRGLTVQVASRDVSSAIPVVAVEQANVVFDSVHIEGAGASDGIDVYGPSNVRVINASVIENNNDGQGDGIGIDAVNAGANVVLNGPPGNCPVLQGNGWSGAESDNSSTVALRCVTLQNNTIGASAFGGGHLNAFNPQGVAGAVQSVNNAFGFIGANGSFLNVIGPVLIQGNGVSGVRLRHAGGQLSTDGNNNGPTIQQNGTAGFFNCCADAGGVVVTNNSQFDIGGGTISNNGVAGVLVEDNSNVRVIGPTLSISGNPIGVAVSTLSTAALFLGPPISGNSGPDLACDNSSIAHGDGSAVGRVNCGNFKSLPIPGGTSRGKKIQ